MIWFYRHTHASDWPSISTIKTMARAQRNHYRWRERKGSVLRDAERIYGAMPEQLVLGHPIAGSEKSGVTAANPDLYQRQRVILTPTSHTGVTHLNKVTALWQHLGAEVLQLSVQEHDDILAATSHLPHALAFSLVDALAHDNKTKISSATLPAACGISPV